MIIKIQKRSVIRFLDHEFQTSEGRPKVNIHVLCFPFIGGFYRPVDEGRSGGIPVTPFREKKVPMTEQEDVDKEHVLYAKM